MGSYRFIRPTSAAQWADYHEIRRNVLFTGRGRTGVYDENHPDEVAPDHYPRLLLYNEQAVATVRLDHVPGRRRGIVRLVAVDPRVQGVGHGTELMRRVEQLAVELGCGELVSNAARDAVPFYGKHGFRVEQWGSAQPPRADGVKVRKVLGHPNG
jgi:GNAT superfamily N-acetyltransferase